MSDASVKRSYQAKVGQRLTIRLPEIPLTRDTEFLRLEQTAYGDLDCFLEDRDDEGEGTIYPTSITGVAVSTGEKHFVIQACDSLTGEEIPGVQPLDISIKVADV